MIITQDYGLIRSIIEQPDILPGFNNGIKPSKKELENKNIVYFYDAEVGLFPGNLLVNKGIMLHAAVPKKNRGIRCINAVNKLTNKLITNGYTVYTRIVNKPHLKRFVRMLGFEFMDTRDNFNYYILRAG